MQLYPKPSAELVIDLIKEANPSLPFPISKTTVFVGLPTAIAVVPPAIANTTARISATPTSNYLGSLIVRYRRISLADLFKNITPNVRKYSATGEAGGSPFTIFQLLPFLNDIYGLALSQDDVNDAAFPAYSTITEGGVSKRVSTVTMTAKATSVAFVGSVVIRTQSGQRELSSAITKQELVGRLYPGSNDFTTDTTDRLNMIGYGIDFSVNMMTPPNSAIPSITPEAMFINWAIGKGPNSTVDAAQQSTFDIINAQLGITFSTGYTDPVPAKRWNLNGIKAVNYSIPHASVPEANSKDFNRVFVIQPLAGNAWASGTMYLHYNV